MQGWRVLVVDDVRLNRTILRRRFELPPFSEFEWRVEEADTGEEMLRRTIEGGTRYDLVTMDENMQSAGGELLGSETVVRYRAHEREAGLPPCLIFASSGNVADSDVQRYRDSGMQHVWPKPLPPATTMLVDIREKLESVVVRPPRGREHRAGAGPRRSGARHNQPESAPRSATEV